MYQGNRAAHDGNVEVDVALFKLGKFTVKDHGPLFSATYKDSIEDWLEPNARLAIIHSTAVMKDVRNYRGCLAERKSMAAETSRGDIDERFLALEEAFEKIVADTTDLTELRKLDSNEDLQDLRDGTKKLMLKIVKMECKVEKKKKADGIQSLKSGWEKR